MGWSSSWCLRALSSMSHHHALQCKRAKQNTAMSNMHGWGRGLRRYCCARLLTLARVLNQRWKANSWQCMQADDVTAHCTHAAAAMVSDDVMIDRMVVKARCWDIPRIIHYLLNSIDTSAIILSCLRGLQLILSSGLQSTPFACGWILDQLSNAAVSLPTVMKPLTIREFLLLHHIFAFGTVQNWGNRGEASALLMTYFTHHISAERGIRTNTARMLPFFWPISFQMLRLQV